MSNSDLTIPDLDAVLEEEPVQENLPESDAIDVDSLDEQQREHIIDEIIEHQREEHLSHNVGYTDDNETADRTYLQTVSNLKLTVALALTVGAELYEAYANDEEYRNDLPDDIDSREAAMDHELTNIVNGDDLVYSRTSTAELIADLLKDADNVEVSSERSEWFLETSFEMQVDDDGLVRGITSFSDMVETVSDRDHRELSLKKPYDYDEDIDCFKPLAKLADNSTDESFDSIHLDEVAGIIAPESTDTEYPEVLIENHHTITTLIDQGRTTTNIKEFAKNGNDVFLFADINTRHSTAT